VKSISIHGLTLQFDAGQITHGSADDQARQAVELINLSLQREPFGLGAQLIVHADVLTPLVDFLQAAGEAVGNCEESLKGLIALRGWLEDRLPRLIKLTHSLKP
jgi:hypothetical protein